MPGSSDDKPGSSDDKSGSADDNPGSADDKPGITSNQCKAVWEIQHLVSERCWCAWKSSYYLSFNDF